MSHYLTIIEPLSNHYLTIIYHYLTMITINLTIISPLFPMVTMNCTIDFQRITMNLTIFNIPDLAGDVLRQVSAWRQSWLMMING